MERMVLMCGTLVGHCYSRIRPGFSSRWSSNPRIASTGKGKGRERAGKGEGTHFGNIIVEIHHAFAVENVRRGRKHCRNVVVLKYERARISVCRKSC